MTFLAKFWLCEELIESQCTNVCPGHKLSGAFNSSSLSLWTILGLFQVSLNSLSLCHWYDRA